MRGLPRLRQPERFAPWLFTIGRRVVVNHLRHAYAVQETSALEGDAADDDESLSGVLDGMEIDAGLSGLPPLEREVLILFYLEDLSLDACAAVLDVPPGTVKSRLHRARRMLGNILTERGYGV